MKLPGILLAALLLLTAPNLMAGEDVNFRYIDSLSYRLYQEQKWDSLIMVGKLALDHQIDYYYLRLRMGIAEYAREKYMASARHFEKALSFDGYSYTAKSYLYFSLLLAGKRNQAYRFSRTFSREQIENQGIRVKPLEHVILVGGYSFANNYSVNDDLKLVSLSKPFGSQLLMGNMSIASAGMSFNFSKSLSLQLNFNMENVEKRNRFQYYLKGHRKIKRTIGQNGSFVTDFIETPVLNESHFDSFINQSELYLNPRIQIDHGLSLGLFANVQFINLTTYGGELIPLIRQDTLSYNAVSGQYTPILLDESGFVHEQSDTSLVNFVSGIYMTKDFGYASIDLSGSFARLYDQDQLQADVSVTYFPLGSLVLYGTTGMSILQQIGESSEEDPTRILFSQVVGIRVLKSMWLEGEFRSGNLRNTHIRRGLVVFNLPDDINFIAGLKVSIIAGKHMSLFFRYDYAHKTGKYLNQAIGDTESEQVFTFDYHTQNIIGGLQWTF